jgi:hypothetical protein
MRSALQGRIVGLATLLACAPPSPPTANTEAVARATPRSAARSVAAQRAGPPQRLAYGDILVMAPSWPRYTRIRA